MSNLKQYKGDTYSQNSEDAKVSEIFNRLDIKNGLVVEFGAADGVWLSNTAIFWKDNHNYFDALLIEPDPVSYTKLVDNTKNYPNVDTLNSFVTSENINEILDLFEVPHDFELLSIDTDSNDYHIWEALDPIYKPKVVIIEANSSYGAHQYKISDNVGEGSSSAAIVALGKTKGYELVAHCGNCIFVRADLYPKIGIEDNDLTTLWDW